MLTPLVENLQSLIEVHQALVEMAERKKESVINDDLETLSSLVKEESKLVKEIERLEEERISLVKTYAESIGLKGDDITLSQLVSHIPNASDRDKIHHAATRLHQLITELKAKNELNNKLIEDALQYVNQSILLMTDPEDDFTYQGTGASARHASLVTNRSFFDTKA